MRVGRKFIILLKARIPHEPNPSYSNVIFFFVRYNQKSGLNFYRVKNITVADSTFRHNIGISRYSPGDTLSLQQRFSAGLTIFYLKSPAENQLTIINSTFSNNSADINPDEIKASENRPNSYIPRGHGGALLLSFEDVQNHRVFIENCTFSKNQARLTGGAISIIFFRGFSDISVDTIPPSSTSTNNTVTIRYTRFLENNCSGEGGAISATTLEAANENQVIIRDSSFHGNRASGEGGAYSFIIKASVLIS